MSAEIKPCSITCEPIFISQCNSQPYPNTGFPNFFNQSHQAAADEIDHLIDIVVAHNCSKHTTKFLCGLLLPDCRENEGLVLPKIETCKEFYAGCGAILEETGNENAIIDCDMHFSENPEPICPAQLSVSTTTDETTTVSAIDSEAGQYLTVDDEKKKKTGKVFIFNTCSSSSTS